MKKTDHVFVLPRFRGFLGCVCSGPPDDDGSAVAFRFIPVCVYITGVVDGPADKGGTVGVGGCGCGVGCCCNGCW